LNEPKIISKQMYEQLFDSAAESYDRVGPNIFTKFGERLVEHMPLKQGMGVLDIATGTGATLIPAARAIGHDGRAIGIDLSGAMLQQTRKNTRAEGLTNTALHKMDAEHLKFPNRIFSAAICAFAIFLFPNIDAALREIQRVCKPGAVFGVSVFYKSPELFAPAIGLFSQLCEAHKIDTSHAPPKVAYAPDELGSLLLQSGFSSVKTIVETNDIVYTRAEDWWEFLMMGAVRATIMGMDEELRARFKDDYVEKLDDLSGADGLHVSIPVVYGIAER
jgi:ubiquinone/menaquinone biosynthesis C-methylase UbiE